MITSTDVNSLAKSIDQSTPEDVIAGLVDVIKELPTHRRILVDLLPEQHRLYSGRSTNEVIRIRGYIFAAFERVGLPDIAVPFILEELESGRDAYLVAGAAIAIRGLASPTGQVVPYLLKAIQNIKYLDDALSFEQYRPQWPLENYTSALKEIFITFKWLGAYAKPAVEELEYLYEDKFGDFSNAIKPEIRRAIDQIQADKRDINHQCCDFSFNKFSVNIRDRNNSDSSQELELIKLEDHDGNPETFAHFFCQKPSILAFFYTRCNNPNKCSLTITKLGHLQKALKAKGLDAHIKVAAITYDPEYDLSFRLKAYAENRGFKADDNNRIFRVDSGFKKLQQNLALGVNFIGSIVNKHRIELFVLNKEGKVAFAFTRLQWSVEEVIDQATQVNNQQKNKQNAGSKFKGTKRQILSWGRTAISNLQSVVPPLLIAFFPKCPVCWTAYLSVFGIAGLKSIPYSPELLFVFAILMILNLWWFYSMAKKRNGLIPFYTFCTGTFSILAGLFFEVRVLLFAGIGLIIFGTLLNNLSYSSYSKLMYFIYSKYSKALNTLNQKITKG